MSYIKRLTQTTLCAAHYDDFDISDSSEKEKLATQASFYITLVISQRGENGLANFSTIFPESQSEIAIRHRARNAAMIVYVGDLIKLSVNSMYVFGTTNESRSHLRAGLVGTSRDPPTPPD